MAQRTAVPKQLRYQVLRRDNFTCRYCGAKAPDVPLTVDHVVPVTLGGQTVPDNLVTACQDCNSGKAATPPDAAVVADVQADAVRWSRAMRSAAAMQLQRLQEREQYIEAVDDAWSGWTYGTQKLPVPRPGNWHDSIGRFHDLDLELGHAVDLVGVAMRNERVPANQTWRYFCGACWRVLRERAELARDLVTTEEEPKQLIEPLSIAELVRSWRPEQENWPATDGDEEPL